jgi:hypothetical protein
MPRFDAAVQQRDGFDFGLINAVHIPLAFAAMLLLAAALVRPAAFAPPLRALALTVLLALLANAAICGALSNPNERYQSRIVSLALFAAALVLLARRQALGSGREPA